MKSFFTSAQGPTVKDNTKEPKNRKCKPIGSTKGKTFLRPPAQLVVIKR